MLLPFALPKTCPLHRQCTALVSNANYRKKVLEDRSRSLKSMRLPHERHQRGAEVSNQDPLPKAASSRLAADAQLWCEFNSWQVCSGCHRIIPRQLTPEGLQSLQDPECRPQTCIFCKSKSVVPQTLAPPIALQNLPSKVLEALRPLEACQEPLGRYRGLSASQLHGLLVLVQRAGKDKGCGIAVFRAYPGKQCLAMAAPKFRQIQRRKRVLVLLPRAVQLLPEESRARGTPTQTTPSIHRNGGSGMCLVAARVPPTSTVPDMDTQPIGHQNCPRCALPTHKEPTATSQQPDWRRGGKRSGR